jgi:hypothetical protein
MPKAKKTTTTKDKKCVTCDLPLGEEAAEIEPTEEDVEF